MCWLETEATSTMDPRTMLKNPRRQIYSFKITK